MEVVWMQEVKAATYLYRALWQPSVSGVKSLTFIRDTSISSPGDKSTVSTDMLTGFKCLDRLWNIRTSLSLPLHVTILDTKSNCY